MVVLIVTKWDIICTNTNNSVTLNADIILLNQKYTLTQKQFIGLYITKEPLNIICTLLHIQVHVSYHYAVHNTNENEDNGSKIPTGLKM